MTDPHSTNQNLFDAVESNEMQPAVELNIEPATVIDLDAPVVFFQTVEDQHQKWQRANPREPNYAEQIKGAYHLSIYELSGDPVKYTGSLVFDIDNKFEDKTPDITQSVKDGVALLNTLATYGVQENQLEIYASGSKGFHIIVNGRMFGAHRAVTDLPDFHKHMAKEISEKAGMLGADDSLYNKGMGKLLRVENMRRAQQFSL